jgi:hypothetical protein
VGEPPRDDRATLKDLVIVLLVLIGVLSVLGWLLFDVLEIAS